MKYDPANPPKYLKQTTTGRIYPFSTFKADRADMEAHEMPAVKVDAHAPVPMTEGQKATIDAMIAEIDDKPIEESGVFGPPDTDRATVIRAAIAQIPVESYGKPVGGKPALPKVAEVSALAGFKVSADEILAIVKE